MPICKWNILAIVLANYLRERLGGQGQWLAVAGCPADGAIAAVFSTDRAETASRATATIDWLRHWCRREGIEELSVSASLDGSTWALVLRANDGRYTTGVGRLMQMELLRLRVEAATQHAWREVGADSPADSALKAMC